MVASMQDKLEHTRISVESVCQSFCPPPVINVCITDGQKQNTEDVGSFILD